MSTQWYLSIGPLQRSYIQFEPTKIYIQNITQEIVNVRMSTCLMRLQFIQMSNICFSLQIFFKDGIIWQVTTKGDTTLNVLIQIDEH